MIVALESILPESNISGIPTTEMILAGHRASERVAINDNPRRFANRFFNYSDALIEASSFEGQILVDIGCGRNLDGYILAEITGATAYIAVEAANMKRFLERLSDPQELRGKADVNELIGKMHAFIGTVPEYDSVLVERLKRRMQRHLESEAGELPVVLLAEDMLTALERFPDSSVSVLASGIDRCIHPEDDYAAEVEKEISRVVHPAGAYIGAVSRFEPRGLTLKSGEGWEFKKYARP